MTIWASFSRTVPVEKLIAHLCSVMLSQAESSTAGLAGVELNRSQMLNTLGRIPLCA
jgi:hypothetical protein